MMISDSGLLFWATLYIERPLTYFTKIVLRLLSE